MNGTVMTIGGIAGIMITTPAGAPVDATNKKRLFVLLPGICTFLAAAIILYSRQLWVVAAYGAMLPLYVWAAASKKPETLPCL
ncbi:hypothetical protein [Chitinophaga silvisoli]|uniref:Uncharacterized protein n=1 Tax=Chitinophaga silvisoli TaxID=2291814 RepID=A0A3E1NSK6_9BACT|nr:hypothetical protein [Chitinophaga silvisoli]RFM30915.1 hypothetical protein DXN04_31790 [Chitinophaga silvisoli]